LYPSLRWMDSGLTPVNAGNIRLCSRVPEPRVLNPLPSIFSESLQSGENSADYIDTEEWPPAASLVDLVRCTVVMDDPCLARFRFGCTLGYRKQTTLTCFRMLFLMVFTQQWNLICINLHTLYVISSFQRYNRFDPVIMTHSP